MESSLSEGVLTPLHPPENRRINMVPSGFGEVGMLSESPQAVGWEAGKPARLSSLAAESTPPDALRVFALWAVERWIGAPLTPRAEMADRISGREEHRLLSIISAAQGRDSQGSFEMAPREIVLETASR